ncbi:glucosyltransferase domain-containing protein [Pseudoteredinibacter isoporae]|uniref:glucosyltransferase domain-containing protein n=1 Tax=Pseudoteredinibacter isoporae TaxID=570281 RepID=UPI0031023A43
MDKFLQRIQEQRFDSGYSLLGLFLLVFITYSSQAVLQAFNADDIIQSQYPSDALTFLAQGRWGYYLVYAKLQQALPSPLVSTFLGCCLLIASAYLAASLLGFKKQYQLYLFVLIGSVSLYYGKLFSFDSTRLAYPLGNFFAVLGLVACVRGSRSLLLVGLLSMSIAPAFYPASTELAATLFLALFLVSLSRGFEPVSFKRLLLVGGALLASLLVYLLLTKGLYRVTGWVMGSRADIDLLAMFSRYNEVLCLFSEHSWPFHSFEQCQKPQFKGHLGKFEKVSMAAVFLAFNAAFIVRYWCRSQGMYIVLFLAVQLLMLLAPFALIFASKNSVFPIRSLYSVPYIYGFYLVALLGELLGYQKRILNGVALVFMLVGCTWVLSAMIDVSNKSFRDYKTSQRNLFAVNRVILDIERVLSAEGRGRETYVPMVLVNDKPRLGGVLHIPWSRERVYHLLDPRYQAASGAERKRVLKAISEKPVWPAEGSIYMDQNTLVVVISR